MNLYATTAKASLYQPKKVSTMSLYLGEKESFKLITTIIKQNNCYEKPLYVVESKASYYLTDAFNLVEGLQNILYSSTNLRRVIGYGEALIKREGTFVPA